MPTKKTIKDTAKWIKFSTFTGLNTKQDPAKLGDGFSPFGQNVSYFDKDAVGIAPLGYSSFPSPSVSTANPIISLHTFRKRSGENVMMRSHTTYLEYYDKDSATWEVIKGGYTTGQRFGFADYNINTDLTSYCYFGNAVENFSRWTGSHTTLTSAVSIGNTEVNVVNTSEFANSGTLSINGTDHAYSSKTTTKFSLTGTATVNFAISRGISDAVVEFASNPKGNIYIAFDNRLFISGIIAGTQAVYVSKYGDATNYAGALLVSASTLTNPCIFNLGEGGGGVIGMSMDEQYLYIFKRGIIYAVGMTDTVYSIVPLKPFDGKSQTAGATNTKSIFTGGNATFLITPDNQILALQRVANITYPQLTSISDVIKPTVDSLDFSNASGIVFKDKAFISVAGGIVLVYNIINQFWESPMYGWNVNDWCVYDDGVSEELYFASSVDQNVFKVIDTPSLDTFDITAAHKTKQFDFEMPEVRKVFENFYLEGYISQITKLKVYLLLDEDGITHTYSWEIDGNDYAGNTPPVYNLFGSNVFGGERFGMQADIISRNKFRICFKQDVRQIPFYNAQVILQSEGVNQSWSVLQFAFLIRIYEQSEDRNLYK